MPNVFGDYHKGHLKDTEFFWTFLKVFWSKILNFSKILVGIKIFGKFMVITLTNPIILMCSTEGRWKRSCPWHRMSRRGAGPLIQIRIVRLVHNFRAAHGTSPNTRTNSSPKQCNPRKLISVTIHSTFYNFPASNPYNLFLQPFWHFLITIRTDITYWFTFGVILFE